jgi:hypothetical protein
MYFEKKKLKYIKKKIVNKTKIKEAFFQGNIFIVEPLILWDSMLEGSRYCPSARSRFVVPIISYL